MTTSTVPPEGRFEHHPFDYRPFEVPNMFDDGRNTTAPGGAWDPTRPDFDQPHLYQDFADGNAYLLPYYLGRYHGFLKPRD